MERGSYQVEKISASAEVEVERLKAQVDVFWDKEYKRYKEAGLRDGIKILEVGSGPGYLTEKLLGLYPNIEIVCLEIDDYMVKYAAEQLKQKNLDRYQIVQGSVMDMQLEDNTFDLCIARLVFEHLPDADKGFKEVLRVLRPGGKAIIVDNDFQIHIMAYPDVPELVDLYDAYCASRRSEGGNPTIGRELPNMMKRNGFHNVDFEVISAHSNVVDESLFAKSEGVGIASRLVTEGFLTSKSLGKLSVKWRDMLRSEEHAILRQLYMATGEKVL